MMLRAFIARRRAWLARLIGRLRGDRGLVIVTVVDERPQHPRANRLYVTANGGKAAFAVMRCPCGCGDSLNLRFVGSRRPIWTLNSLDGPATVRPSIWRTSGCQSHFFLTDGEIIWCRYNSHAADELSDI